MPYHNVFDNTMYIIMSQAWAALHNDARLPRSYMYCHDLDDMASNASWSEQLGISPNSSNLKSFQHAFSNHLSDILCHRVSAGQKHRCLCCSTFGSLSVRLCIPYDPCGACPDPDGSNRKWYW